MAAKNCRKCGASFQYDPWVEDRDFCPKCLPEPVPQKTSAVNSGVEVEATVRAAPPQMTAVQPESVRQSIPTPPLASDQADDLANLTALVGKKLVAKGAKTLNSAFKELREADFQKEVISHDADSFRKMFHNMTFWLAMFMGVLPLLILTFTKGTQPFYGILFFFAVMWAGIFKGFILNSSASLKYPVMAFFFTGMIGIGGLLLYHTFLPENYLNMSSNSNQLVSLLGWIINTGVNEEICKIIPVVLYVIWRRKTWSVEVTLLIGVFSGLGFATFENIRYGFSFADNAAGGIFLANNAHMAASQVHDSVIISMTMIMIRSLSCLFGHTIYTGIATCFIIGGLLIPERRLVRFFLAIAVPAVIHGAYDWSPILLLQALIDASAFILFFGYLQRTRRVAATINSP